MEKEKSGESGFFRNTRNLSISVLLSRILGLVRDMLLSAVLGGKVLMGAWTQASTFANIARQILGEGALGQALVPILSKTMKDFGAEVARKKFTTVFIYLTLFLCVLNVLVAVPIYCLADWFTNPIWHNAALIFPIVLPYSIFICAVGVMTSYMNMLRVFFLPSLTAILHNFVVIGALFFICPHFEGTDRLRALCVAVLISGICEFAFMLLILRRQKMRLNFESSVWTDWATLKEVLVLGVPGMLSASVHVLSTASDRLISGNLSSLVGDIGNYATSALYFSDRIVLLPVGVFAFAFSTVALTELSHAYANRDFPKLLDMLSLSMRNLLFITIPITALIFVFREPIIRMLFQHGQFGEMELHETAYALQFYVFAIPSYALMKVATAAYMAQRKVWLPFYVGLGTVLLNICLSLLLMKSMRQGGIALATVLSVYLNIGVLMFFLNRTLEGKFFRWEQLLFLGKVLLISILPLCVAKPLYDFLAHHIGMEFIPTNFHILKTCGLMVKEAFCLGCAGLIYGGFLLVLARVLNVQEGTLFLSRIVGRLKHK